MDSREDTARSGGLPHSEIPGSKSARLSPELIAACHVLHRLSTPRHPPDALRSLLFHHPAPAARPAPHKVLRLCGDPAAACTAGGMRSRPHIRSGTAYPCCRTCPHDALQVRRPKTAIDGSMPAFTSSPFTMSSNDPILRHRKGFQLPTLSLPRRPVADGTGPREVGDFVGCHGGPGPIRTADLTLIRGAL